MARMSSLYAPEGTTNDSVTTVRTALKKAWLAYMGFVPAALT